jgi:hypothetical protein
MTDARCKAAKPADKPYKLFDGGGLYLFVTPAGAKVWRITYRIAGKQKNMSLGPYPLLSLAAARERRESIKLELLEKRDPMAPRKAVRKGISLLEARAAYWAGRNDVSQLYRTKAHRAIEMHLGPSLGDTNIAEIDRVSLLEALKVMDDAGKHEYVRKVKMWVGHIFDWAVENGMAIANLAALIRSQRHLENPR